ncbi:hypothetical protein EDB89DRAFT_1912478 [Lactarius sanguifluus]|nr:hypothetical protein EDB89DRAFT_1912478 [Lactarius sanguifluus]
MLWPGSPLLLSSSVDVVRVAQLSQLTGIIAAAVLLLPASPRGHGQRASPRCNGRGVAPSLSLHRCRCGRRLAVAGGGIVASACGLKQPAGWSSYAKLAITGRGKHRSYCTTLVYDNGSGTSKWPATRRRQTHAGTLSMMGRPQQHYGMARQVEHDNNNEDEDDIGPRRQRPTATAAYNDNGLPTAHHDNGRQRQRSTMTLTTTTAGGDTERR